MVHSKRGLHSHQYHDILFLVRIFSSRGTEKEKSHGANKPNPGGDLIQFRFYIYSDNKDSLRVS